MDFNAKTNPGRESRLQQLEEDKVWDVLIIGGGATGAGIAVDAAARGFSTVLFDTQDFSEGTSSRSTKLIHGGVRYMKNPRDWKLVREAMIERKLLLGNAPHIVHPEPFILPCYENFEREYYMAGLCLYGAMAYGGYEVGKTEFLSAAETIRRLPGVKADGLKGGVQFWDAQFDDSRLNIALMKTAEARGALLLNYVPVVGFESCGCRLGFCRSFRCRCGFCRCLFGGETFRGGRLRRSGSFCGRFFRRSGCLYGSCGFRGGFCCGFRGLCRCGFRGVRIR